MGHAIEVLSTPATTALLSSEQERFIKCLSAFRKAFYHGSRLVIRSEYVFLAENYDWAAWRLSCLLSEMRACAIANPADYFLPKSEYMEKENGDEYDSMTVVLPSHDAELPHRIHIRNKVYPF